MSLNKSNARNVVIVQLLGFITNELLTLALGSQGKLRIISTEKTLLLPVTYIPILVLNCDDLVFHVTFPFSKTIRLY